MYYIKLKRCFRITIMLKFRRKKVFCQTRYIGFFYYSNFSRENNLSSVFNYTKYIGICKAGGALEFVGWKKMI